MRLTTQTRLIVMDDQNLGHSCTNSLHTAQIFHWAIWRTPHRRNGQRLLWPTRCRRSTTLVAFIVLECFDAFLCNNRNRHKPGHRPSPVIPPTTALEPTFTRICLPIVRTCKPGWLATANWLAITTTLGPTNTPTRPPRITSAICPYPTWECVLTQTPLAAIPQTPSSIWCTATLDSRRPTPILPKI